MKKYAALVVTLLLVAAHVRAQVSGIASYLLVGRSTVAAMPAAASVVRGLWYATDDTDCNAATSDDGWSICVDTGASWAVAASSEGVGGGGGAPDAHASTHEDGGSDEIDVTGLLGLLATAQTPAAHTQAASTISDSTVAGRTLLTAADASAQRTALALGTSAVLNVPAAGNAAVGEVVKGDDTRLTDSRTPTSHASTHENGGVDELSVAGLSGVLADAQTPAVHSHTAAGDVDGDLATLDLDESAVESELESVLDLPDLQGAVTDSQVPDTITASNYAPLVGATFTGPVAIDNAQTFKLLEADANGSNFFALVAPSSLTGDTTCTIAADGKIPDSCVGDGTDASGGVGDVVGPASATDECFARFDSTTGKLIQNSVICATDAGTITLPDTSAVNFSTTIGLKHTSTNVRVYLPSTGDNSDLTARKVWIHNGSAAATGKILLDSQSGFIHMAAGVPIHFGANATAGSGEDVGIIRDAAGRLRITNGGSGVGTLMGMAYNATGGNFTAAGDAQARSQSLRNSTTNGTPTELFLNGSSTRMALANDTTWTFSCLVVARRTDADGEGAGYKLEGVIDRQTNAASTALIGSVTTTTLAEDNAAWDAAATADTTNGALVLTVTGEASKTIRWVASCQTAETTG